MDKDNITATANQDNLQEDPLNDLNETSSTSAGPLNPQPILSQYNTRNPAVKRLMREALEMSNNEDRHLIHAHPLDDNLFEWHYTFRGPPDTPYHGGIYHGRVCLPSQYPMQPPEIMMITPNGRFETNTKICLSISSFHPETWQPSWSIRTAILALRTFMSTDSPGAIGSIEYSESIRRSMALNSCKCECCTCGPIANILDPEPDSVKNEAPKQPDCPSADNANTLLNSSEEALKTVTRNSKPQSVRMFGVPNSTLSQDPQAVVVGDTGLEVRGGDTTQPFQDAMIERQLDEIENLPEFQFLGERQNERHDQGRIGFAITFVLALIGSLVFRRLFTWFE